MCERAHACALTHGYRRGALHRVVCGPVRRGTTRPGCLSGLGDTHHDGALALAAALWLPNSQRYLGRAGYPAPGRFAWRPSLPHAFFLAVLAIASLLRLKEVSEFLYFQYP